MVVINEVLTSPISNPADLGLNATTNANSLYNTDFQVGYNREWVELYNPSGCDSVDISCYTLACNMNPGDLITYNWGAFTFPSGTIIPPHGYLIVGGNNAQVPVLDFNISQYRQSNYGVSNLDGVSNRWFLRDEYGWVAIYDPNSVPVDAVYWNYSNNPALLALESEYLSPITTRTSCSGIRTFPAAVNIPGIEFVGAPVAQSYLSFQRTHDGSLTWFSTPQTPTPRANNYGVVSLPTVSHTILNDYCDLGIGYIHYQVEYHGTDSLKFQWISAPFDSLPNINHLHAGSYIVRIFDPYYCETHYDTIQIINQPKFNLSIINVTPQLCSDSNGTAEGVVGNGHSPYIYHWNSSPIQSTNIMQHVPAGLYTLTVTDYVGCVVSDTVSIQDLFPMPPISLSITNDTCSKGIGAAQIINNSSVNLNYLWNNGTTASSIHGLVAGSYSITVQNGQCFRNYAFDILNDYQAQAEFNPIPSVMFTDNPICEFFDYSVNPISWQWNFGDGNFDITSHPTHAYTSTGSYLVSLLIEDDHGCFDSISRTVVVKENSVFYIPNAFSPNGDSKNEVFKVSGINIYDFELRIFTRWGEQIFYSYNPEIGWDGLFMGKECPQGVYVWHLLYTKDKEKDNSKRESLIGSVTLFR